MELDVVVVTALALHEAIVGCFPSNHGTWAGMLQRTQDRDLWLCKLGTLRPPEGETLNPDSCKLRVPFHEVCHFSVAW